MKLMLSPGVFQSFSVFIAFLICSSADGAGPKSNEDFYMKPCKGNADCGAFQCCPVPGLDGVKECTSHDCQALRLLAESRVDVCRNFTIDGRKFLYCTSPKRTWWQSLLYCESKNGTLTDIKDAAELVKMWEIVKTNRPNPNSWDDFVWSGGQRVTSEIGAAQPYTWLSKSTPFLPTLANGSAAWVEPYTPTTVPLRPGSCAVLSIFKNREGIPVRRHMGVVLCIRTAGSVCLMK